MIFKSRAQGWALLSLWQAEGPAPIRRMTPNPDRPQLPPAVEEALAPVHQAAAEGYAALERAIGEADQLVADVEACGGVPSAPLEISDTDVFRIEQVIRPPRRHDDE